MTATGYTIAKARELTVPGEHLINRADDIIHMPILTAVIHKEEDMYVADCPETGTARPVQDN